LDAGRRPGTEEYARRVENAASKGCVVVGAAAMRKRGGRDGSDCSSGGRSALLRVGSRLFPFRASFEEPAASVRTWFRACMTGGAEGREVGCVYDGSEICSRRIFGLGRWVFQTPTQAPRRRRLPPSFLFLPRLPSSNLPADAPLPRTPHKCSSQSGGEPRPKP